MLDEKSKAFHQVMHAIFVTYNVAIVDAAAHSKFCEQLSPAFAVAPGLISETWLGNQATGRYGVFFVFETKGHFDSFVASELFAALWFTSELRDTVAYEFTVNRGPTAAARRPARAAAPSVA